MIAMDSKRYTLVEARTEGLHMARKHLPTN